MHSKIEEASVLVYERVTWSSGSRRNHCDKVLTKQTFRPNERWQKINKETMKEQKIKSRSPTDTYRGAQQQILEVIHAAIHDGENRAVLNIPSSGLQTYQGVLIKVCHQLKIQILTSGCCTDNPTIELPIYLGTPSKYLTAQQQQQQQQQQQSNNQQLGSPPPVNVPLPSAVAVPVMPSAPPASPSAPPFVPTAPPSEWASAVTATPVVVGQSTAVVGGNSVWEAEEGDGNSTNNQQSYVGMATVAEVIPSLSNLIKEIEYSVSPQKTLRNRIDDDDWKVKVFYVLTPQQYASLIKAVSIEFDQVSSISAWC